MRTASWEGSSLSSSAAPATPDPLPSEFGVFPQSLEEVFFVPGKALRAQNSTTRSKIQFVTIEKTSSDTSRDPQWMRPARNFNSCVSSTRSLVKRFPALVFIRGVLRGDVPRVHALKRVLFVQRRSLPLGMRPRHGFMGDRLALFSGFGTTGWAFKVHCVQHVYSLR